MARKPVKKSASSSAQPGLALKPGLITIAIALGWGALNEPATGTIETMTIWALTMGAVALAAHAALVLSAPVARILIGQCRLVIRQVRSEQKS